MQLEEYHAMVPQDLAIRKDQLNDESARTYQIHDKFFKYWQHELNELRRMSRGMNSLVKKKTEYYLGKSDPEVYKEKPFNLKIKPIKSDLNLYLNADPDIQRAQEIIDVQETKVTYLRETLNQINRRGYEIREIREDNQFKFPNNVA